MRSDAGAGTITAKVGRLRPAILFLLFAAVWLTHRIGAGSVETAAPACSPEARATLEQIARAPADSLQNHRGRDPRRACVTEYATPGSDQLSRILVLRDTGRCVRDFCFTEIWAEHRVGGYSVGFHSILFTRPRPVVDRSAAVPTLTFASATSGGGMLYRLVYSRAASQYLPIGRGGSPDSPHFRPMRFSVAEIDGRPALFAEGNIATDTVRYFERAVRDHRIAPGSTIFFNSPGGETHGGIALGRAIRRMGLRTDVARPGPDGRPSELRWAACLSACTLAFLGGTERRLHAASRLGFHAPVYMRGMVTGDSNEEVAPLNAEDSRNYADRLKAYLHEVGVNGDLAARILAVRHDRMCSLSRRELAAWGVLNRPPAALPLRPVLDAMDCRSAGRVVRPAART